MYYVQNMIFVYRLLCIKKRRRSVLQVPGSFAARSATDASVICDARVISPFGNVCRTWPFLRRGVQWHVWNIWDTEILKKMPYIFWEATNDRWESLFVVWSGKSWLNFQVKRLKRVKKIAIWYWARCSLELSKRYQSSSLLLVVLQPSSSQPGRASSASSTSFARAARTYNQTMDVGDGSDQVSLPQPAIRYVMTMDPCRTGSYYAIASFHSFPISPSLQWYLQRHTTSTPVCPGQLAMARPCPFDKTLRRWDGGSFDPAQPASKRMLNV